MAGIFINPFTDFGFKKLFGEEVNKDLLIDFLNELIPVEKHTIVDLTYLKNEHLSNHEDDRRAVYDLYCENEKGEKFIVEIQRAKQKFFKDRSIYYSTFPIQEQAKTGGKWDFELKAVYSVAIMDFTFEDGRKRQIDDEELSFLHTVRVAIALAKPKGKTLIDIPNRFQSNNHFRLGHGHYLSWCYCFNLFNRFGLDTKVCICTRGSPASWNKFFEASLEADQLIQTLYS